MKKSILFTLMALLPLIASAYDAQIDGVYYNLIPKAKQAEVTSGDTKYKGSVTIPESFTYDGVTYSVKSIDNNAFQYCSQLTSVTIPSSITNIGKSGSMITVGAFDGCSNLTSVHITDIAAWCGIIFTDYRSNPLYYAKHLFMNGKEITDLVIPNSVTSIGNYAFSGCEGLTSVTIPNSVTKIGWEAFSRCFGLTSVTIPNSVTEIGYSAFSGCSGLTSVNITDIEAWCKIRFSSDNNPLYYAHHLYLNGNEIKDLIIPNSVTSIGEYAFYGCSGLTSVTIPNSVTSIGTGAFSGCSGLTSVTIPSSLTTLGQSVFSDCSGLTSVNIPNSVTSIGNGVFSRCSGLTSVTIPNSVTSIGNTAFSSCSGLTEVKIGSGVRDIGSGAFAYCAELSEVYCYALAVPTKSSYSYGYTGIFQESYIEYATLYVPEESVMAYKAAEPWSGFGTIKTLSGDIPETPKCAMPTISYIDGELRFSCETEGVEFVYEVECDDTAKGVGETITLTKKYIVSVYATKAGYDNSDVAAKEINFSGMGGIRGDVNQDGEVNVGDMVVISNIMSGNE